MQTIAKIISVSVLETYTIQVVFGDGHTKTINMLPYIKQGVSPLLKDELYFKQVYVENGYITWPNSFDFCPEFLRNHA